MSNAAAFADFGKDSSDLLLKGFPISGFKTILDTKTPNSIAIKTTLSGPEKLSLAVQPTFTCAERNFSLKGEYSTSSAIEGTASVTDFGTKGTKFEITGKKAADNKTSTVAGLGFVNHQFNAKLTGTFPCTEGPASVNVDLVGQYPPSVFWGLNAKYERGEDKEIEWNPRIQMVAPHNYTVSVLLDRKKDKSWDLSWLWFQQISPAVKYSWSFVSNTKANTTPTCTVGGEYKLDDSSTVKARVSVAKPADATETNLRVGLAWNQILSQHTTVTVGADINGSTLLGSKGGADHSLGFEIKLK